MERKLINYLPYQVREFKEYRGITTGEQPEFELAWNYWQEVFDNQYIDTAGDYGLSRWEKMLEIAPKATDTLEARRIRIKARLNNFTPYTVPWLNQWLTWLCGPNGHRETITDYTFELWLNRLALPDGSVVFDIEEILLNVLPENLWWKVTVSLEMQSSIHIGGDVGAQSAIGVPMEPDVYDFRDAIHAGGHFSDRTIFPVQEDTTQPPATTILRSGGVFTFISNLSGEE